MSARPYFKFFSSDWMGDVALRSVSPAARGIWIDCLCLMDRANQRGHLLINGSPVEITTLARITGTTPNECSAAVSELVAAGVCSMIKGVMVSRRMIRDEKAACAGSKSVKKRWGEGTDEKGEIRRPNRVPITHSPESIVQSDTFPRKQQQGGESERASESEPAAAAVPSAELAVRLCEAAGWTGRRSLAVTGPISTLLAEGFDLDIDVLPVIRARAATLTKPVRSWGYFVEAIREARERISRPAKASARDEIDLGAQLDEARRRLAARKPDPVE